MKKRLFWLLALTLSLLLALSLLSCEDTKSEDGDDEDEENGETGYQVTKDEWIKAIELDGVSSISIACELDGGAEGILTQEMKFCNGLAYMSAVDNGKARQTYYVRIDEQLSFNHIISTGDPFIFIHVINEYLDYAYAQFEYNEDGGYYEFTKSIDEDVQSSVYTIKVYFGENKYISKIDIAASTNEQAGTYTYVFSKYNNTDAFSIPANEIDTFISESFPVYSDRIEVFDTWLDGTYAEEACNVINNLVASLDRSTALGYFTREEGSNDIDKGASFDVPSGSIIIAEQEINFAGIDIDVERVGTDLYYMLNLWEKGSDNEKIRVCSVFFTK